MPKTSVLMPVFNEEKYLRESIESVLGQKYSDFELLVLDDNSTDKSLKIIKEYSKNDRRVRFIANKEHIGYTKSLNVLLNESRGEYICIVGADDVFLPNRLEVAVKFHEENPDIGASYSDYYWINDRGETIREINCMEYDLNLLLMSEYINVTTMMVRRKCLVDIGGFDEELELSQDSLMKYEVGHRFGMKRIPETLVKYRLREDGLTMKESKEQGRFLEIAKRKFRESHPEFRETRVTVGVPVYNPNMRFLVECLNSIKNQTFRNYDVVVLDDGSENRMEVKDIVEQYGFKYFYQKNGGIGAARNAIIDRMPDGSDYLCYLSQDDIMHEEYLKVMCQVAKQNIGCVVYSDFLIMNERGQAGAEYNAPRFETPEDFCVACLSFAERNTMFVNFSTTLFPAELVREDRFDGDFRYGEDLEFLLRSALVKKRTYFHVPDFLVKIRMHADSVTTEKQRDIPENNAKILRKIGGMLDG